MRVLRNAGPYSITASWFVAGVATNVGAVTIGITDSAGTVVVAAGTATTNNANGTYTYQLASQSTVRTLYATWTRTDTSASISTIVEVIGEEFRRGYATLNELKAFVAIARADTDFDSDLERAIETASRIIDNYCGQIFFDSGAVTAKTFRPDTLYRVSTPPFHTTTGLVVKTDTTDDGVFDTTWAAADYQVEPYGTFDTRPYNRIVAVKSRTFPTGGRRARVEVSARWGWAAVPVEVEQTCLIVAGELWRRKDAPFGVAGFGPDGAVRVTSTEMPMLSRLDHFRPVLVF